MDHTRCIYLCLSNCWVSFYLFTLKFAVPSNRPIFRIARLDELVFAKKYFQRSTFQPNFVHHLGLVLNFDRSFEAANCHGSVPTPSVHSFQVIYFVLKFLFFDLTLPKVVVKHKLQGLFMCLTGIKIPLQPFSLSLLHFMCM